ncbi:MAG: hypothetical protein PHS14_21195 [Elusimicrobia bacterium]|nr:hypothetical protein [Elusimicrobiota bacterium]
MTHFADHGGDSEIRKRRLYRIDLATPVYWTDFQDHDIETSSGDVCGAHRWVSKPITPGPISNQPDGQSASFSFADADGALFTVLSTQNGGELAEAFIYEAGFLLTNKTPVPDEVLEIFSGRVDRTSLDTTTGDAVDFVLMPPAQKDTGFLPDRLISTLLRT